MENSLSRQKEIVDWFDKTYKNRSLNYLRPVDAYRIFIHLLNVQEGKKILDTACGPGQLLKAAHSKKLSLHGIDISPEAIRQCKQNLPEASVQVANAEALPFKDQTFDYLTCLGSLERILNLEKALKEQIRVANADARFCYMVRNADAPSWKLVKETFGIQNHKGHQSAKSLADWTQIFESTGFEIINVYSDQWPLLRWKRWLSLNSSKIDYTKIREGWLPLKNAYEFIFLLKKKN